MEEPERLRRRPHHGRFAIPFVSYIDEQGIPNFKAHDNEQRERCARRNLCQLCGEDFDGEMVFVGLPGSVERRTFGEPPMHRECMEWAWEVCPWLAGRNWSASWRDAAAELTILPPPPDAEVLGIYTAEVYAFAEDEEGSGSLKWKAGKPTRPVEWRSR